MTQWLFFNKHVAVSSAGLGDFEIPCFAEVGDNFANSALGDSNTSCQFRQLDIRLFTNLHDNVTVVAQECPIHLSTIAELE